MKKQVVFLVIILATVVVFSGCLPRQQTGQKKPNSVVNQPENNTTVEDPNEVATTTETFDTSTWETFIDEKLGISVKYPKDRCYINGSPVGHSSGILCDGFGLSYDKISDVEPNIKDYEIKKIAELIHTANIEDDTNIPEDRYISEVERIEVDGKVAYQFILNKVACGALDRNYKCTGGGVVSESGARIVFIEQNNEKFQISLENDRLSKLLLENFHFLDN